MARSGSIDVRLISGDHMETAIHFALEAKIIKQEDIENSCMTGEEFRKAAGGYRCSRNGVYTLDDKTAFENLILKRKIRVIARARPEDK